MGGTSSTLAMIGFLALLSGGCVEPVGDRPVRGKAATVSARPGKPAVAPVESPTRQASSRLVADRSGISFRMPAGLELETERFDAAGPLGQMRHRLVLSRGKLERLSVEVWDNPTSLPVGPWFEEHLAFVRDGHARISWSLLSSHRVRGMLIRWPTMPQAFAQRMAIFSVGGRVVRVTCQDQNDAATLAGFKQVVSSITIRGAP